MKTIATIAELIEELKKLPPDAVPIAAEPPFDGVRLIPQENGNKILIASLRN